MIEYFKDNISIFEKKNVVVSNILKHYEEDDEIGIEYENGYPNLYLENTGHRYYLHSRYNKIQEAEEKVDVIDFEMKKVIFVIGIGGAYHIKAIQDRMSEDCTLVVIEPNLNIFHKSMKYINMKEIIENENTYFIVGETDRLEIDLDDVITRSIIKISNFDIFMLESSKNLFKEDYEKMKDNIYNKILHVRKNMGNSPLDSLIGLQQMFFNIKYMIESRNFNDLSNTGFENIPIVSVASGPSLNKNIKLLKKIKNRALIICCDTAYDSLVKVGIKPHIVTVLEREKALYDKVFVGKTIPEDVLLVCEGVTYPEIFKCFKGRKITVLRENVVLENWGGKSTNTSLLKIGPSVANLNIALAKKLKSKCLILIGQDLAYSNTGNSHAEGTIHEGNVVENDIKNGKNIEYVEDINGELIKTTEIWKFFLEWINEDVKSSNIPVIDATEGGAKINNTEITTLDKAIEKYCNTEVDVWNSLNNLFAELSEEDTINNFNQFKSYFYEEKNKIEEIITIIQRNKDRLEKLKVTGKFNPEKINEKIIPINNDIYLLANDYKIFYQIIQSKFINLGNENSRLSYIHEKNFEQWKEFHYEFFFQLEIHINLYKDIFDKQEKILKRLEKEYVK